MTLEQWKNSGQCIRCLDFSLFYQEAGNHNQEKLLLIHGFPTASWDWYKTWDALSEKFHVFAPDMLGFGFSEKPKGHDYTIMEQADLLEDFLTRKGISSYHIFAHDYGDTVAQELLARHEDRLKKDIKGLVVKSVCFLNGGLFPETHRARFSQKLLLSPLGGIMATLMNKSGFKKAFDPIFGKNSPPSQEEIDAFWELINYNNGKIHFHKLIRYMVDRRVHRERWVGVLQNTRVPIRVIDGPDDPVSGLHMTERYKELVPNPDVVLLPGIGHYPHTEAPAAVLKAYFDFVNQRGLLS